ncbi:MAG TPA: hypothetical protein DCM02_08125, partial [Flavobacterium sp.]|nr:hypothetical protein [Flavobacterium sp.]
MKLRQYQTDLSIKANDILKEKGIVYLSAEVRTGKTITALETARLFGAEKVLFITKIRAFNSIRNDYKNFGFNFSIMIINKESIHKFIDNDFDLIICDEAHGLFSTYPKQNGFTKIFKKRFSHVPMILMSGTATPESYSQWYHQFWVSDRTPFKEYTNFYKWAKDYVNVTQKHLGHGIVNDYSNANYDKIMSVIKDYILTFTQAEAGFQTTVEEEVLEVEMRPITYQIIDRLKKDNVVSNKDGQVILADTGAKMMQKQHQLFSGTVKLENGIGKIIDNSKVIFIKDYFEGKKIAIFYKFQAELEMLQDVFCEKLTTNLEEFNTTDKWIALQFVSGREGISLRKADYLV